MTKLYFHDALSTNSGTLPDPANLNYTSNSVDSNAAGAGTDRSMDTTLGTLQVSCTLGTVAQTATQNGFFRRFLSAPLAAQTILAGGGSIIIRGGIQTSNATNSPFQMCGMCVYVWRPSTGALVGKLADLVVGFGNNATASETDSGGASGVSASAVTCQDGDILVCEVFGTVGQGMATSYTWTFYYDGTTEGSTTSNAAYIDLFGYTLLFYVPPAPTVQSPPSLAFM